MFKKGKRVFYVHQSSFLGHSKFTHGTHAPSIVNFFVSGWGPGRSWRQRLNTWIGCPCLLVTGYCRWEQCSCPSFICCGELDRCVIIQLGLASLEKGDTLSRLLYFWVIISEEFDLNLFGPYANRRECVIPKLPSTLPPRLISNNSFQTTHFKQGNLNWANRL